MAKTCRFCGMENEDEHKCSWCGKALEVGAAAPPTTKPPAEPSATPSFARAPASTPRGAHAGAAAAMMAREAERAERGTWQYWALGAGILIVIVVGGSLIAWLLASGGPREPDEFQALQASTGEISLQAPANWESSTGGAAGSAVRVTVRGGRQCSVSLRGSQILGTMGDIAAATSRVLAAANEGQPLTLEQRAEGKVHALIGQLEKDKDRHFRDEGEMQEGTFMGQPAAWSHYTTRKRAGLFSVKLKGLRLTCPTSADYTFDVRAQCPEKHWAAFEPTALKIIQSASRAQ